VFEKNLLENNGQFGISIGHKDSDNLLQENIVRANDLDGVFFRNETIGMAGHRNQLINNIIENNGRKEPSAGIRVRGETNGLIFKNNTIRDTRDGNQVTQKVGVKIEESAGEITLKDNTIVAETAVQDLRGKQ
jgi:parallel beta-helix repeat protein